MKSSKVKAPRRILSKKQVAERYLQSLVFTIGVIATFALVGVLSMLFVQLTSEARDREVFSSSQQVAPGWDTLIPVVADIGGVVGVGLIALLVSVVFLMRKDYTRLAFVAISVVGGIALAFIIKAVFMAQRPDIWMQLVNETGYSFPSGHALMSAVLGLTLAVALWRSRWRWWGIWISFFYVIFVGFSRIYLGVHYLTDVLVAWAVAFMWVLAITLIMRSKLGHLVFDRR